MKIGLQIGTDFQPLVFLLFFFTRIICVSCVWHNFGFNHKVLPLHAFQKKSLFKREKRRAHLLSLAIDVAVIEIPHIGIKRRRKESLTRVYIRCFGARARANFAANSMELHWNTK